jgi:hypothetical protein
MTTVLRWSCFPGICVIVHKVYDYSLKVGKRKWESSEPRHKHVAAEDDVDIKHR